MGTNGDCYIVGCKSEVKISHEAKKKFILNILTWAI